MKLKGKVAIVTGAASGIGRGCAIAFAQEGAKVVVADLDAKRGAETAAAIAAQGNEAIFVPLDVTVESEVKHLVDETIARWGKIDILFNNAGVVLVKALEEMTEAEWDRVMGVNVKEAFLAIK